MTARLRNWAGNIEFAPASVAEPESLEQLQDVVAASARVRVLGSGHSFNRLADTDGTLLSTGRLPVSVDVDPTSSTVTVGGNVRFAELVTELDRAGFALHNLGSLPHISVAGSFATGTHGSGVGNGCLASTVCALELVTADGERRRVDATDPDLDGLVVGLGCFGVVTGLTMRVEPSYEVVQRVFDDLPWGAFLDGFDAILSSAYSVSVFTRYQGTGQVWTKQRLPADPVDLAWSGARPADGPRHPVPGMPAEFCTQQLGVPGRWHERLAHFRAEFPPSSSGDELQSEFFVARERGVEAVQAVASLARLLDPVVQIAEVRSIAADGHWLCPTGGRDSVALHFTWVPDAAAVTPVVGELERVLAPYDARPHWGKVFTVGADRLRPLYPRWDDHVDLVRRYDPTRTFRNKLVDSWFGT